MYGRRGVQIDIKQLGKHEYNPQGWTSQTGQTHNRTQFDTHEFRQTVKALATTGVKAASMETRRDAAFAHWNTELVNKPGPLAVHPARNWLAMYHLFTPVSCGA